jgi:hypothetical protein
MYGRRYYSFTYKNTLFVILDSNDDDEFSLTRQQTDFALKTLKDNPNVRWTFVLMHHPIWTYNTDGRFQEIETALKGRKFTVIAGHVHHYLHAERNGANYYTLATTGAGNALRGNYFGEFDHISWLTVTKDGPVMANLRLDGILPHDVSHEKTAEMAKPLLANAKLTNVFLCNKGERFTNGTLDLLFENTSKTTLEIDIRFFHHHQLQIDKPVINLVIEPGGKQFVEVPVKSSKPLDYKAIDLLFFDWEMKYAGAEYKGFGLKGKYQVEVKPSQTSFIDKGINCFTENATIGFDHRFSNLESRYSLNNSADQKYTSPIRIDKTTRLSFFMKNGRNEFTSPENRIFEKTGFMEGVKVENPKEGLAYSYFEGEWQSMPDFTNLEAKATGVANNLIVTDLSKREDYWGLVYSGYFKAETENLYIFRVRADDACRFYIDNKPVVDEATIINGENVGAAALKKGFHPVRIEYIEKQGTGRLRIFMKNKEGEDWKLLEPGPFYH